MQTELQKTLAKIAPNIFIQTIWDHDPDHHDIREDCDGFDDENPEDWQAWQSEIRAACICEGREITGSTYLGGTWEKAGDNPALSNPEISGYERQMTEEALKELLNEMPIVGIDGNATPLRAQIDKAIAHLSTLK